ncbi:immunoglobulin-like domain-containing protein [Paenibacillus thalictri]|uniref:SLH domain-containing protein n=1 Tax=Paenibacillus thalictri TaxID=2527873 RepID=A0A4Q9DD09_9BACL|nr:immunoglobulin-like domain-containing protein [Paenibacillus thalictri]TBL68589.1 hypothetical protein EYB31_37535 [Paenibacillus thalictri]
MQVNRFTFKRVVLTAAMMMAMICAYFVSTAPVSARQPTFTEQINHAQYEEIMTLLLNSESQGFVLRNYSNWVRLDQEDIAMEIYNNKPAVDGYADMAAVQAAFDLEYDDRLPVALANAAADAVSMKAALQAASSSLTLSYYNSLTMEQQDDIAGYLAANKGIFGDAFLDIYELQDNLDVQVAQAVLAPQFAVGDSASSVTNNIVLPTTGLNGVSITWSSDDPSTIAVDGTVTRPVSPDPDVTIVLTADLSQSGPDSIVPASSTRTFTVTVKQRMTDAQIVASDLSGLQIEYASGNSASSVTQSIYLPVKGTLGADISWSAVSSYLQISGTSSGGKLTGQVTRPSDLQGDQSVVVTAEATKGSADDTKTFTITIKAEVLSPVVTAVNNACAANRLDLVVDALKSGALQIGAYATWAQADQTAVAQYICAHMPPSPGYAALADLQAIFSQSYADQTAVAEFDLAVDAAGVKTALASGNLALTLGYYTGWGENEKLTAAGQMVINRPPAGYGSLSAIQTALDNTVQQLRVPIAKTALTIGYAGTDSAAAVTQNVSLPISGLNGTTISWSSDAPNLVSTNGTVNPPSYTEGDRNVTLTATIAIPSTNISDTASFTLTLKALQMTDAEAVQLAKNRIEIGYAQNDSVSSVTRSLTLSVTDATYGASIIWSSSMPAYVTVDGTVTRPTMQQGGQSVLLTANVQKNGASDSRAFTIYLPALAPVSAPVVTAPASLTNNPRLPISGTSLPSGTITVYVDGVSAGTAISNAAGQWTFLPTIDWAEGGRLVKATFISADGTSGYSNEVSFTVDVTPPTPAVLSVPAANASSASATPVFQGSSQASVTVSVYVDQQRVGSTTADAAGNWTFSLGSALSEGIHNWYAVTSDKAGNVGQPSASRAYTVTVNREPDSNAALGALQLSVGTLSPAFSAAVTEYEAFVVYGVHNLSVTAAAYASSSSIFINGQLLTGSQTNSDVELKIGDNPITVMVVAEDGVTNRQYTVHVRRNSGSSSSQVPAANAANNSPDGQNETSTEGKKSADTHEKTAGFAIVVNGKQQEQIAEATVTSNDGKTIVTATIDAAKLESQLSQEAAKPTIVIPVSIQAEQVRAVLTGDIVKSLENKDAVLEIQAPAGSYKLPASLMAIDKLAAAIGKDQPLSSIQVQLQISRTSETKAAQLQKQAFDNRYTVIIPPVDFTLTASFNGKTIEVETFNAYVERELTIPDGIDPSTITTAVVLNPDGTVRHVPTFVTYKNGKYVAVINSLTNSTYSLINRNVSFGDIEGHWSQAAVENMALRMILDGKRPSAFKPDDAVTRSEFAAIVVRALGLPENGSANGWNDVKPGDWFNGAVGQAQRYGLIGGYEDATFRPGGIVTRQEAFVIMARAMKLAGIEEQDGKTAKAMLARFADCENLAPWAEQAAAAAVSAGLVQGSAQELRPQINMTRAETAALIERFLVKAKLIQERK